MQELDLLNSRLDALLKRYAELRVENRQLKEVVAQQTRRIEALNDQLADVEQQVLGLQLGTVVLTAEQKVQVRRQLDTVVGEIDKILTSLND